MIFTYFDFMSLEAYAQLREQQCRLIADKVLWHIVRMRMRALAAETVDPMRVELLA